MKNFVKTIVMSTFLFYGSSALASNFSLEEISQGTKCTMDKRKAKKAKKLFTASKKQAKKLHYQLQNLIKNQKRKPASTPATKKYVMKKMRSLKMAKNKKIYKSKKYLMKHKQFKRAAVHSCGAHRARKQQRVMSPNPLMMDKYQDMTGA